MPLSLQRNSCRFENKGQTDLDQQLEFSAASTRKGQTMKDQEDRFLISETQDMSLYAVMGGHAGHQASQFCKDHLKQKMADHSDISEGKLFEDFNFNLVCKQLDEDFLKMARD